jgi:hypothetical protein
VPYVVASSALASGVDAAPAPPPHHAAEDDVLLFFMAGCSADESSSMGMRFRAALFANASALLFGRAGAGAGAGVACPNRARNQTLPHARYLAAAARARFCAVLPGDFASTSRLSEVARVAAAGGCVPAVLGPPWPTLPLLLPGSGGGLDWAQLAEFVEMDPAPWLTGDDRRQLAAAHTSSPPARDRWAPEPAQTAFLARLRAAGRLRTAASLAELADRLRAVPAADVGRMRAALARVAHRYFPAAGRPGAGAGADAAVGGLGIADAVCAHTAAARAEDAQKEGQGKF